MEVWIDRDEIYEFYDSKAVADILGNEKSHYAVKAFLTPEEAEEYNTYLTLRKKVQARFRELYENG